jgi:tetratricopeptide (TPR) repeat protein
MNREHRRRAARIQRQSGAATGHAPGAAYGVAGLLPAAQRLHNEGRFSEAAEICGQVLALEPRNAEALLILGSIAFNTGNAITARAYLEQSIAHRPADPRAWILLSSVLVSDGDVPTAVQACQRALEIAPDFPAAHVTMGSILASQRQYGPAEAAFRRALDLRPDFVDAEINLGSALFYQGRLEEAIAAQRRALGLQARNVHALRNPAASLRAMGQYEEALAAYRQAGTIATQFAEAHRDEALLLLLLGRYEEGWTKYEWRWRASALGARPISAPRWNGEPLDGRTIILQAEQGIGDTLQFLRYAPLVAGRGGNVILNLPASLKDLGGEAMSAVAHVTTFDEPLPACDCYAPLLSLPRIFATTLDTIPTRIPYLRAPAGRAEKWQRELSAGGGRRVGVVWAGNPGHENDHNRSIPFARLLPLFAVPDVQFFSLQVGERAADVQAAADRPITNLSARLVDFGETAGAIEALDLLISVDTAMAHLAGALGKPVWLLLPHVPDWRWLLEREDSPWYPGMRLFRQAGRGDWEGVIGRIIRELSSSGCHH